MSMPDDNSGFSGLGIGSLAALLGGGAGLAALGSALRGKAPPVPRQSPELAPGVKPAAPGQPPVLGSVPQPASIPLKQPARRTEAVLSNVNTAMFDEFGRAIHTVRRLSGDQAADSVDANVRTLVGHAGKVRQQNALHDGILSLDGTHRITAHRILAQAHSFMAPADQDLFYDGMSALNLLDRIDGAAKEKVAVHNVNAVQTALHARASKARANPNVRKMMDEYNGMTRGVAKYNRDAIGTVSNTDYALFSQQRAYLPMRRPKEKVSIIDRATNAVGRIAGAKGAKTIFDQSNPYLGKQSQADINDRIAAYFNPNPDEPRPDLIKELGAYIAENVKHGGENQARRSVIDALRRGDAVRGDGRTVVRRIPEAQRKLQVEGDRLAIWRGGVQEDYQIGDAGLYRNLLMQPHFSIPFVADLAKVARAGTTGAILQPLFAGTAMLYDIGFLTLAAKTGKIVSGPLDALLVQSKMSASKKNIMRNALAGAIRTADMPITSVHGFLEGMKGRFQQELVRHAQRDLAKSIGQDMASHPIMEAALNDAVQKFEQTRYSDFVRSGYTAQSLASDWQEMNLYSRTVEAIGDTQITRPWMSIIDSVRDCARMGLFCRGVAEIELKMGRAATPKELRKIATNVREAAADPTRMGTSGFWSGTLSSTMFGNVIAQSGVHLIRALANPASYSVALTVMAYRMAFTMWSDERMGPEESRRFHEETPSWKKATGFAMPKPGTWLSGKPLTRHDMMWVPLSMELGSVTNIGESIMRGLIGVREMNEPGTGAAVQEALFNLINFNVPTALDEAAMLVGMTPFELHMNQGKLAFQSEPMRTGPGDETGGDRRGMSLNSGVMHDWTHDMLSTAFGTAGTTFADAVEATIDVPTQPDDAFMDSVARGADVVWYDIVDKRMPRFVPIIGGRFVDKDSKGTPLSNRYYELTNYLEAMHKETAILQRGRVGEATNPSGSATMKPEKIVDRDLRGQIRDVERFFDNPTRKRFMEKLGEQARREMGHRGNPELSRADQARSNNFYNDELQESYRKIMDEYAEFEDKMKREWQDPNWSLNKITGALKRERQGLPAWSPITLPY